MNESAAIAAKHEKGSPSLMERVAERRGAIKIASMLAILVGLFLIARTLPVGVMVAGLETWVDGMGIWGPLVFGGIYVVAVVLFVPGSAITLAAGAVFGLFWGFITVSLASTTAAGIAFLVGRYAARDAVRQQADKFPRFKAVDRAIGEGGWKIVALLRLVPVFPYSMGNYLLGLTAVRFWPYVLASWIAMMPGTFVYVYFGHLGRAGLEAAGDAKGRDPLEWALLILGVLAAVGVTVYITRIAKKALAERTEIKPDEDPQAEEESVQSKATTSAPRARGVLALAGFALVVLVLGACAQLRPDWLSRLFGPPPVEMTESHAADAPGAAFDHGVFDSILRAHVSEAGWIDYAGLKERDTDNLHAYTATLADVDFDALSRDEKLALLINAYNAFTIQLILDYWNGGTLRSIKDIPSARRWDDERWRVGEHTWSLNQIEHEQIRPNFREPRIHWAVVCAAIGCPPLRAEAYTGPRLEEQLDDQARFVHTNERWVRYDRDAGVIHLTMLYDWYGGDFEQVDGGVLMHASRYIPTLQEDMDAGKRPRIRWLDYDWTINNLEQRP